ncbi:hypothetical protein SEA_GODONK_180 [Gordonia phage GodonK]|uniref:Uncharacterized protein n=1 Tax=Gordonia phage GodonK TaxID=2562192 RepID=A0A4D6E2A2_9CAUD|nr:hypothetical protein HOV33_gp188 [Gordonia phage GodonK]QBZ72768.1 hypothetical protein SEA_GODONK_180 [Gordonia phage GodonK]
MVIVCCEHNPCPYRPTHFLWRYRHRPWRCDQCGKIWVTVDDNSWSRMEDLFPMKWKLVKPAAD